MPEGTATADPSSPYTHFCRVEDDPPSSWVGWTGARDASSIGDWFPDESGHVDHEAGALPVGIVRRADLAHTDAHNVVQVAVPVAVAEVKDGADDLPSPGWGGAAISVRLEHDCRAVVGVDDGAEVWPERTRGGSAMREVRAAEATTDGALAMALGEKQVLLKTPSSLTIQLSGYVKRIRYNCSSLRVVLPLLANQPCWEHYRPDLAAPPEACACSCLRWRAATLTCIHHDLLP